MKLTKEQREKYLQFVLDAIENDPFAEGYNVQYDKNKDIAPQKVKFFFETFQAEFGYLVERVGTFEALRQYLMSLPNIINLPFHTNDILNLSEKFGSLKPDASDKEIEKLLKNYWGFMVSILMKLKLKYHI